MAELILGPMLRHVTATSATIWMETDESCLIEILDHRAHTFLVAGHHYALVVIDGLTAGTSTEYDVRLDGSLRWPAANTTFPPSRIRTLHDEMTPRIMFGSCRTAAPHEAPWSLEFTLDTEGRGVDAVYAYALRMMGSGESEWPDLAVFVGDQIYADDSSPRTRKRIEAKRAGAAASTLPAELVDGFEEYCWLYEESWSPPVERWFFSVVPTAMVFDDHDMIDDWNISATWVHDIRREDWWERHILEGLMTYWLYQHLGNLSPNDIRNEGILEALTAAVDGDRTLRDWASATEEFTGGKDRYRFSFVRDIGNVRLVVIDARNSRTLTPGNRRIVDAREWQWIVESCHADVDHLLIGSSLPVFTPGGIHDLQVWNEEMTDGAWGKLPARLGEWIRRKADLEDWPAFVRSFDDLVDLLADLASPERATPLRSIAVLSGDIHFSYASEIHFPGEDETGARVFQLVNSPIRNALRPHERMLMRFFMSRVAHGLGRVLRRAVGRKRTRVHWQIDQGPVFANCIGILDYDGDAADLLVEQATPYDAVGHPALAETFSVDLRTGHGLQLSHPKT